MCACDLTEAETNLLRPADWLGKMLVLSPGHVGVSAMWMSLGTIPSSEESLSKVDC